MRKRLCQYMDPLRVLRSLQIPCSNNGDVGHPEIWDTALLFEINWSWVSIVVEDEWLFYFHVMIALQQYGKQGRLLTFSQLFGAGGGMLDEIAPKHLVSVPALPVQAGASLAGFCGCRPSRWNTLNRSPIGCDSWRAFEALLLHVAIQSEYIIVYGCFRK